VDIILTPLFAPLVVEAVVGCLIGMFSRRAILRILAWLVLPWLFGTAQAALDGLFTATGEAKTRAMFELVFLVWLGYLVSTVAVLIGYLMRRVSKQS
jgi:hypothetical protein